MKANDKIIGDFYEKYRLVNGEWAKRDKMAEYKARKKKAHLKATRERIRKTGCHLIKAHGANGGGE